MYVRPNPERNVTSTCTASMRCQNTSSLISYKTRLFYLRKKHENPKTVTSTYVRYDVHHPGRKYNSRFDSDMNIKWILYSHAIVVGGGGNQRRSQTHRQKNFASYRPARDKHQFSRNRQQQQQQQQQQQVARELTLAAIPLAPSGRLSKNQARPPVNQELSTH